MLTENQEWWKRYIVPGFSDLMIKQLARHGERGNSWREKDPNWLLGRAKEELKEVEDALHKLDFVFNEEDYVKKKRCATKECADVACFMMMIVDSVNEVK